MSYQITTEAATRSKSRRTRTWTITADTQDDAIFEARMNQDETPGDLMKALADSLPPTKAERAAPHTADEWDEIVSGLRRALAEAESCWREALRAEREAN